MSKKEKGFTLIELLVVIAIIALLLSVIMPALTKVKDAAKLTVCLSNHKNLATAWKAYAADNNSELVFGHTEVRNRNGTRVSLDTGEWVLAPFKFEGGNRTYDFGNRDADTVEEYELNGIQDGALFPYLEAVDVYRCKADRRYLRTGNGPGGRPSSFRSYSITATMNGEGILYGQSDIMAFKEGQITSPASRFVFIDDFDSRSFNMGSWIFRYSDSNPNDHKIADPISVWHFKKCNFSYADGHAEPYSWKDQRTHLYSRHRALGEENGVTDAGTNADNVDVQFLARGYKAQ